ncbi:unnamed protein product [Adineta steineri]|uniref:Glucomannan synthase n=1 Tax=Adineta steineri TaxID=433720 RepID=A0A813U9K0_9BILA|nr:unnamed protein product [Adineta steineri]CAF3825792.1 unnamed protein product [Adineta steineri]
MDIGAVLSIGSDNDLYYNGTIICENYVQCILPDVARMVMILFTILYVIVHADRLVHILCRFCLKKKPYPTLYEVIPPSSTELDYPIVAIQLPMMNEVECGEAIIEAACNLDWPKSRLIIQVLDDSSDKRAISVINNCVDEWAKRGIQINVYRRPHRHGFKAGSLIYGMTFIRHVEYICIFDADFLPTKDFLSKAMPSIMQDPTCAFVQARWTYTNSNESFLTRMQTMILNFHFKCEQEGRYRASFFFNFNGTAAIWRTSAIEDAGGWHTDTVVEDLDLSLRSHLNGWNSVYLYDVECLNELPPTLSAYLSQQYRWVSGPMQVALKLIKRIYRTRDISFTKKLFCFWFMIRYYINLFQVLSLIIMVPMSIWFPTTRICSLISMYTTLFALGTTALFTLNQFHYAIIYVMFVNGMALFNTCASISGLLNFSSARDWIVTPKFGSTTDDNSSTKKLGEKHFSTSERNETVIKLAEKKKIDETYSYRSRIFQIIANIKVIKSICYWFKKRFQSFRLYKRNFLMSIYLFFITWLAFNNSNPTLGIFVFCNAIMYTILAFGYIGRFT